MSSSSSSIPNLVRPTTVARRRNAGGSMLRASSLLFTSTTIQALWTPSLQPKSAWVRKCEPSRAESCWPARRPPPPIHAESRAETSPWQSSSFLVKSSILRLALLGLALTLPAHTLPPRGSGDGDAPESRSALRAGGRCVSMPLPRSRSRSLDRRIRLLRPLRERPGVGSRVVVPEDPEHHRGQGTPCTALAVTGDVFSRRDAA